MPRFVDPEGCEHVAEHGGACPELREWGASSPPPQTSTDFTHDARRRLHTVQTYRGPPVEWTTPPVSYVPAPNLSGPDKVFQSILEDGEYVYDEVDNPTEIRDHRNPAVWPAGAKPVTRKAEYDDLYRLTRIQYEYAAGDDTWVDPFDAETTGANPDTRRAQPSPHVSFAKRVLEQTYQYDWLGNLLNSSDDAKGFYDRSLGTQSHSGTKPYQLTSATGASSSRDGNLTLAYDPTGNTTSMALVRNGPCLPSTATCSQRFAYDWDEVGRLSRARRWDLSTPGVASDPFPVTTPSVELRYTYDASDSRVVKTAVDANANERHTVYVFASLELRRAVFDSGDYVDTKDTEALYLFAHGVRLARVHFSEDSLPTLTSGKQHVLLELPDHLGSSSIVVDKETGELAERSTYMAYGGADSDYRPDRWGSFREDYRFTGKEEDAEVGLDYFGKRYLAVGLNRWLSADPLAVHMPGKADPNLYAVVRGAMLRAIDPVGLDAVVDITRNAIVVKTHIEVSSYATNDELRQATKILDGYWNAKPWTNVDSVTGQVRSVRFEFDVVRRNPWEAVKDLSPSRQNSWDRLAGKPPPPPDRTNQVVLSQEHAFGATPSGLVAKGRTDDGHVVHIARASLVQEMQDLAHEVGHVMGARDESYVTFRGGLGNIQQASKRPLMTCNAAEASSSDLEVTQAEVDSIVSQATVKHNADIDKFKKAGVPDVAKDIEDHDSVTVRGAAGAADCRP